MISQRVNRDESNAMKNKVIWFCLSLVGTIIDANTKEPIEGATIQLEAVTHSVKTNRDGKFQFVTGQKLPFTLILTSVGYAAKKVVVERSPAVIELIPSTEDLDEVFVVGYGLQKRRDFTGSLSSVSQKALQQPVNSFDKLLQGTVVGAQVTATSGQPGGRCKYQNPWVKLDSGWNTTIICHRRISVI